jgi:hypothetical protein
MAPKLRLIMSAAKALQHTRGASLLQYGALGADIGRLTRKTQQHHREDREGAADVAGDGSGN